MHLVPEMRTRCDLADLTQNAIVVIDRCLTTRETVFHRQAYTPITIAASRNG